MCLALVIMSVVGLYMYCKLRIFCEAFIFADADAKILENKPLRNDETTMPFTDVVTYCKSCFSCEILT